MPEYKLQKFRGGFAISVYENGKRISRQKLESSDQTSASEEFHRIVQEAKRPVDPDVSAIWQAYMDDKAGRRIAVTMSYLRRRVLPFFGRLRPNEITRKTCRAYIEMRRTDMRGSAEQRERFEARGQTLVRGVGDYTIRTELGHLRTALLWAEKDGMISRAPWIEMPPVPQATERHLTREEFERLLNAAQTPHLSLYLLLAISTAGRNAALLELTWDRVDFSRGLIYLGPRHVQRPQKGRATVPMTDALRRALSSAMPIKRCDRVIEWAGEPVASVRTALNKAVKRAGLSKVTPHMLRHSAAVWMAEAGISMSEISAFLGHADSRITERVYAKYSPAYLRRAAGPLEIPPRRP